VNKPKLAVPAGATDTHIHIYQESVPPAPGGPPLPGHFPVEAYRKVQERVGLSRVIVVQPNAYQDDNRVTLEAIRAFGTSAKGVGVVKPGVADAEIERLTKGGIEFKPLISILDAKSSNGLLKVDSGALLSAVALFVCAFGRAVQVIGSIQQKVGCLDGR
jgi:hypothetical protein